MKTTVLMGAVLLALGGCAGYDGRWLVPGQATLDQVEKLMGPAADKRRTASGETVHFYPRLPYGRQVYAARFDPAGRLVAVEPRLTEAHFAKVKPGVSRAEEVREIFGAPYKVERFPRMERDAWTWPVGDSLMPQLFVVQLSNDQVVREAFLMDDPGERDKLE